MQPPAATEADLNLTLRTAYDVSEREAAQLRIGPLLSADEVLTRYNLDAAALTARLNAGRLIEITLRDSTRWYPAVLVVHDFHPDVLTAAPDAFEDVDPTGVAAVSWLTQPRSPNNRPWRTVAVYARTETGRQVLAAMARVDADRYAATLSGRGSSDAGPWRQR